LESMEKLRTLCSLKRTWGTFFGEKFPANHKPKAVCCHLHVSWQMVRHLFAFSGGDPLASPIFASKRLYIFSHVPGFNNLCAF
jgi:hypothetical protein